MSHNTAFRKMLLKAWGYLTGSFDFQSTRIKIAGALQTVWQTPDSLLIQYMIDKGGDFARIHSLDDIRSIAAIAIQEDSPHPHKRVISGAGVIRLAR